MRLAARHRRLHGAAMRMTEHHDKLRVTVLDGIFNAAHADVINHVSRCANDKEVAQSLVVDYFGRLARVRATYDDGERLLGFSNLVTPFGFLVLMRGLASGETLVAGLQPPQRFIGADIVRFVRPGLGAE